MYLSTTKNKKKNNNQINDENNYLSATYKLNIVRSVAFGNDFKNNFIESIRAEKDPGSESRIRSWVNIRNQIPSILYMAKIQWGGWSDEIYALSPHHLLTVMLFHTISYYYHFLFHFILFYSTRQNFILHNFYFEFYFTSLFYWENMFIE